MNNVENIQKYTHTNNALKKPINTSNNNKIHIFLNVNDDNAND